MPRLTSYRGGSITSTSLDGSWWRLQTAALPSAGGAGLGLVLRYPPAMPLLASGQGWVNAHELAQLALAVADINPANTAEDVKPLAEVALASGDRDKDIARVTEALNLFRNLPRVKDEIMEVVTRDVISVVDGYWKILAWHKAGCKERLELRVADADLVGQP